MFKFLFFLPFVFLISNSYGATCTNTTRTNYSSNQVLTSSALNADFNQLVTKANAMDGGCVSDNTLESTAFDSSLDALKNGIHQGCALSYSDANTVSVGKCILSVNGNFVKTIVNTSLTWGCSGCSAEVVSTQYYVYAKSGSIGTTLNLLISTVAPGNDGYDSSGNKVLGKFYNNSSGAIELYSIYSWDINKFTSGIANIQEKDSFMASYGDGAENSFCSSDPCTYLDQVNQFISSIGRTSAGNFRITFFKTYSKVKCTVIASPDITSTASQQGTISGTATSSVSFVTARTISPYGPVDTFGTVHCEGY